MLINHCDNIVELLGGSIDKYSSYIKESTPIIGSAFVVITNLFFLY